MTGSHREESILTAFGMGFLEWNPETMIVRLDHRACKLFGLAVDEQEVELEELTGRIHPDDRERVEAVMAHLLSDGGACEEEFRVIDEAGGARWLASTCRLREEPGEQRRIFCLCSDISKRRHLANQQMGDFLHATDREKSLVGSAIHDTVCQDLRAIGLMSETLLNQVSTPGATPEEAVEGIEAIRRVLSEATERAVKLARGISPLSVKNQTLRQSLAALRDGFTELYPHIRFEFATSGPPEAPEDQKVIDQLYCVAQEAIRNAIHHGDPSRIVLTLVVDDTLVQQTIEDNGGGAPEQLQAHSELGQGLRIMAYRIDSIGGWLRIESTSDRRGIRITSTLPRRKPAWSDPAASATLEALENCLLAIETLSGRPESPGRDEEELKLQLALIPVLMANRGFAVPEVGVALERARDLCLRVPNRDSIALFSVACGLWQFHQVRSELDEALDRSQELMSVARNESSDNFLAEAHRIVGGTTLFRGEFVESRDAFELGLETYNENSFFPAEDPLVLCLYEGAWAHWLLGNLETARTRTAKAIALARESENPFTLVAASYGATMLRVFDRDVDSAVILARELCELAGELDFAMIECVARVPLGWALAMQGDFQRGFAEIRAGIAGCEATRAELQATMWKGLLADALRHAGQHSEVLVVVETTQKMAIRNHELWWVAELQRLEGESNLAMWPNAPEKAEQCFRRALGTARAQHARGWELRAATSLARLLVNRGAVESAREVLAPITAIFSSGPVNADVLEAKQLLSELPD